MGKYTCPACTVCGPTGEFNATMELCQNCKGLQLDIVEIKLLWFITTNFVPYDFEMNARYFNQEGKVAKRLLQIAEKFKPQIKASWFKGELGGDIT